MMDLSEWKKKGGYRAIACNEDEYLSVAQQAAKLFLSENILNVRHVYLANRFGEYVLFAYIPDEVYAEHQSSLTGAPKVYHGFKVTIMPMRQMIPGLECYCNEHLFSR